MCKIDVATDQVRTAMEHVTRTPLYKEEVDNMAEVEFGFANGSTAEPHLYCLHTPL